MGLSENILSVLVAGAVSGLIGCSVQKDTQDKERREISTSQDLFERSMCEIAPPDDLTKRILDEYKSEPEKIRHAIRRIGETYTQGVILMQALGDHSGTRSFYAERLRVHNITCPGFQPTNAELLKAAEYQLERHNFREAFGLFERAGNREGQQKVAERAENNLKELTTVIYGGEYSLAYNFYHKLNDAEGKKRIATLAFKRPYRLTDAEAEIRKLGITASAELYRTRGDYWAAQSEQSNALQDINTALESHQHAGTREKILELARVAEKSGLLMLAAKIALEGGDATLAKACAEKHFIQGGSMEYLLKQGTGITLTSDLYKKRGQDALEKGWYSGAFEAFRNAGDTEGMATVLQRVTAPVEQGLPMQ